jgi:hypothetical protein
LSNPISQISSQKLTDVPSPKLQEASPLKSIDKLITFLHQKDPTGLLKCEGTEELQKTGAPSTAKEYCGSATMPPPLRVSLRKSQAILRRRSVTLIWCNPSPCIHGTALLFPVKKNVLFLEETLKMTFFVNKSQIIFSFETNWCHW